MGVPISNVTRRVVYAASGTGPYAFTFEILANTDIAVYRDDTLLTLTTDYTVTIAANGTGSITLVAAPTGATQIAIVGNRTIQRTTDFVTGGDFFANTINNEMDQQTIFAQQNAEGLARSMQAPQTDPTSINMTLPRASVRAGKYLSFDNSGNPVAAEGRTEVAAVYAIRDEIVTVAGIDDQVVAVAGNATNINTVAGISSNVTTVAGISANVTTVAGNNANVTSVAGNAANINTVAGSIANVNNVGGSIASVNTVAGELGAGQDVTVVAANLGGTDTIGTVAGSIANVDAVGTNISNVNAVNSNATNINTVAGQITPTNNVSAVAAVASSVATVAGISSGVTTVAGISANVTTVAGVSANVTTVAGSIGSVNTVSGSIASVNTNATNIANINQNAANIAAIQSANANANSAAASAASASTQANNAAASAAAASAVVLGNEPVRPLIRPSLLLDFANTEQLDPRITFTRASTAAYYGTQTAKAEENLLVRSQELGVGAWATTNATITANSTAAPDGTTTADTLIDDATSGAHFCSQVVTMTAGIVYTQSFFLKANTNNFAIVTLSSTTTNNYISAVVNLSTGAITQTGTGTSATFTSSSITSVGSGWYRVVITGSTTGGFTRAEVGLAPAATGNTFATNGRIVYVGTGTSIFVWGAQLEQRSAATAYTATTADPITTYIPQLLTAASGVARFDHNPTTFESLGLLIEESRANFMTYSEDFGNAIWLRSGATALLNTTVAPDGTITADSITFSASGDIIYQNIAGFTYAAGASYTFSIFIKSALRAITYGGGTAAGTDVYTSTLVGNGWYRQTLTRTFTAAGTSVTIQPMLSGAQPIGVGTFAAWGSQFEAGAFATSYIPTVASQVTRAADAASMTGTNFSSWYNAGEGTLYSDFLLSANQTTDQTVAQISNGTSTSDSIYIYAQRQSSRFRGDVYIANAAQAAFAYTAAGVPTAGTTYKMAFGYKVNDFAMTINSNTVSTDTAGNVPVVDRMFLGTAGTGGVVLNGTIKKLAYYPLRVTNAQLQALTTV